MKQFLKSSSNFALSLLVLVTLASPAASKLVALDIVAIYEEYSLVQEANATIDAGEARFKRILATAEKELQELEKKGNHVEIEKKRQGIQDIVDQEVEILQDHKELYNTTINRNVARTLAAMAAANNYELILDSSFVHSDIEDITTKFLAELEKATLPVKLEE